MSGQVRTLTRNQEEVEEIHFKFEANEDCLLQLIAMGISLNGAKKALYRTGNSSVTLASNWIFDHPELDLETPVEEEIKMEMLKEAAKELEENEMGNSISEG